MRDRRDRFDNVFAMAADVAGFGDGDPQRLPLKYDLALEELAHIEQKTEDLIDELIEQLEGLGLARRGANPVGRVAASEPQRVAPPLRGREGHSHAERGAR